MRLVSLIGGITYAVYFTITNDTAFLICANIFFAANFVMSDNRDSKKK